MLQVSVCSVGECFCPACSCDGTFLYCEGLRWRTCWNFFAWPVALSGELTQGGIYGVKRILTCCWISLSSFGVVCYNRWKSSLRFSSLPCVCRVMALKLVLVIFLFLFFFLNERGKKYSSTVVVVCVPFGKGVWNRRDCWETVLVHWTSVFQAAASRWYSWN